MPTKKSAKTAKNTKTTPTASSSKNNNLQLILIAVLSTIVVLLIAFVALILTGIIKIGDANGTNDANVASNSDIVDENGDKTSKKSDDNKDSKDTKSSSKLINNPNPRVKVNGRLMKASALEFYLPDEFEAASTNPSGDGVYTYNLTDDDGWAVVNVYVEKTNDNPTAYLMSKNSTLEVTDENYEMNGQTWVQAENGSSLAYTTRYGDHVYAIIYVVKLDSDAASEAMSMLPKTLYFPKLYK